MQDNLSLLVDFFITVTIGGLGFIVYNKHKKSFTNKLFLLLTIFLIVWVNCNFFENWIADKFWATIFLKLDFIIAPIGIFFIALFLINFPRPHKKITLKENLVLLVPALGASLVAGTELVIKDINFIGEKIGFSSGPLFLFYAAIMIGYSILGLTVLSIKLKRGSQAEKKQIKFILLGFSIMLIFFMVFNLVLQNHISKVVFRINTFSPIIFILITGYAIVKHQLFNIKIFYVQLLTVAIWALVFLQFFFIKDWVNYVVTAITLGVAILLGIILIKSVKSEIKRKNELEVANAKLLKVDRLKSEFISMASHQLRTPLTTMKGFISIMRKGVYGEIPSSFEEPMRYIENSNDRLIVLVEDMLNVSQIEAGRMVFNFKKENINYLVEEIFHSFKLIAQENNLKLEIKKTKGLPKILIDYGKMRETISNIVDNAIKYTKVGGVKIETKKKDKVLEIIISDTGIGIEKEGFDILFDKFSRGKEAQEMKKGGTGLGLYLGKKIVEAHRGKIKVKSEGRDKGSVFIVQLPIFKK